jgi:hypothetical protein
VLRHALWPDDSPEELALEAEAFFSGGKTLLRAVLLAEHDRGQLLGFAELLSGGPPTLREWRCRFHEVTSGVMMHV